MGETLRLSLRLLLFALIAAVLLAATSEITKGPIAEQAVRQANEARELVLPGVEAFEPIDVQNPRDYPAIDAVHEAKRGGEVQGYTILAHVQGYKGQIVLTLAVNASGSINALAINSQTETAGLGNKITGEPFLSQFPGLAASEAAVASQVDAIAGATVSSSAVIRTVETALRYAASELGIKPKAGEIVTVETASAYEAIERRTGAKNVKQLAPYEAAGYPNIQGVYSCSFDGQSGYLFEFEDRSLILSDHGEVLGGRSGSGSAIREAQDFLNQFLKKEASAE